MTLPVTGSGFDFKNKNCDTIFYNDIDYQGKGIQLLRVKNMDKDISFNVRDPFSRKSEIEEINILMDFISINYGNIESLEDFFRFNGFLFKIGNESYSLFKCKDLFLISHRMKLLIELIDELSNEEADYNKLIKHTAYLLLVPSISLEADGAIVYESANIAGSYFTDDFVSEKSDYYDFENTFLEEDILYVDNYSWQNLYETYLHSHGEIDFEPINEIEFLSVIYANINHIDLKDTAVLNDEKVKLDSSDKIIILDAARKAIKQEIDHHLSNITPTYNSDSLEASWDIPDLITALYFSILFSNPNFKILKNCKNPNCINYFTVHKSNNRKMYCSTACGNAVSQRRFREKNKKD